MEDKGVGDQCLCNSKDASLMNYPEDGLQLTHSYNSIIQWNLGRERG